MKYTGLTEEKLFDLPSLERKSAQLRFLSKSIAFTNGCFDLLHEGHLYALGEAAKQADFLIVGLNSDASVKRLKGAGRPIMTERSRARLLASMLIVDAVIIFDEDTPINIIRTILPDVLVKGADYTIEQIDGSAEVLENGGKVVINELIPEFSTTSIIQKLRLMED